MQLRLMRVGKGFLPQKWLRWGHMVPGRVFLEGFAICLFIYFGQITLSIFYFIFFTILSHPALKYQGLFRTYADDWRIKPFHPRL